MTFPARAEWASETKVFLPEDVNDGRTMVALAGRERADVVNREMGGCKMTK